MADATYTNISALDGSYASEQDLLELSLPLNTKADFSSRSIQRWLRVASSRANAILGQRFNTPLRYWSDGLVWAVCEIAMAGLMNQRGHDPEAKTEQLFAARERKALEWLEQSAAYEITPDPRLQEAEPDKIGLMISDAPRGWSGYSVHDTTGLSTASRFGRFINGF